MSTIVTRFAPSPTGHLHLGHAFSAMVAHDLALRNGGKFLLRIEDIDLTRSREEFVDAQLEDLAWLGLEWEPEVWRQSDRLDHYRQALDSLQDGGLLYPCFCTRKDILREISEATRAPHGPDGPVYPGTCRRLSPQERDQRLAAGTPHALRLDIAKAVEWKGEDFEWLDLRKGAIRAEVHSHGDIVIARKEVKTSYHLAVTVDDAAQGVTLVTRGMDLFHSTHIHRLLQALLDLPVPRWFHHDLIVDADGKRLAKRDRALELRAMRKAGATPGEIRERLAPRLARAMETGAPRSNR